MSLRCRQGYICTVETGRPCILHTFAQTLPSFTACCLVIIVNAERAQLPLTETPALLVGSEDASIHRSGKRYLPRPRTGPGAEWRFKWAGSLPSDTFSSTKRSWYGQHQEAKRRLSCAGGSAGGHKEPVDKGPPHGRSSQLRRLSPVLLVTRAAGSVSKCHRFNRQERSLMKRMSFPKDSDTQTPTHRRHLNGV